MFCKCSHLMLKPASPNSHLQQPPHLQETSPSADHVEVSEHVGCMDLIMVVVIPVPFLHSYQKPVSRGHGIHRNQSTYQS